MSGHHGAHDACPDVAYPLAGALRRAMLLRERKDRAAVKKAAAQAREAGYGEV